MRPGTYRVEARLEGFESAIDPAFTLRTGHTGRLSMTLRPRIEGEIEVLDSVPLVDVFRTDSSTNIVPEQMMSLPVPDRAFDRLAAGCGSHRTCAAAPTAEGEPIGTHCSNNHALPSQARC